MSDYCTTEDLALELGIYDANSDDLLELACTAASRQIEDLCGRRFWLDETVSTRVLVPSDPCLVDLLDQPGDAPKVEIGSTSGLIVKADTDGSLTYGTTLTSGTDFQLWPLNAAADGRPYSEIRTLGTAGFALYRGLPTVQVTAKFGWPAVPDAVKKATLIQAAQLYKSKDAVFGAVAMGESGAMFVRAAVNPTAKALVAGYARVPVG